MFLRISQHTIFPMEVRNFPCLVIFILVTLFSLQTFAQVNVQDCNSDITFCSLGLSSTSSTTTALGAGLLLSVLLRKGSNQSFVQFLELNHTRLAANFAMGGGLALDDFRLFFNVPDRKHKSFDLIMRKNRMGLRKWIRYTLDQPKTVNQFIIWMQDILVREDLLSRQRET